MRCMSFALESSERKEGIYSIFDLLKYNFYLPFFFFGPVMTFDQFHAQVSAPEAGLEEDLSLRLFAWVQCLQNPTFCHREGANGCRASRGHLESVAIVWAAQ